MHTGVLVHWLWGPGTGDTPAYRRPRNRNQMPQLLFSILVDMRRDGATITITSGHRLKARRPPYHGLPATL